MADCLTLHPFDESNPSCCGHDRYNISYSVISGDLPAGLTLDSQTGLISGTSTETVDALFTFTVEFTITNKTNPVDTTVVTREYSLLGRTQDTKVDLTPLAFSICNGSSFYHVLEPTGGYPPYTITFPLGGLPPSLVFDGTAILGVATQSGIDASPVVHIEDSSGLFSDFTLSFHIPAALYLEPSSIAPVIPSEYYEQQLIIHGLAAGEGSITLDPAQLPTGLSYDANTNTISGTTLIQNQNFLINCTLSDGTCTNSFTFTLRVYKLQLQPYSFCVLPNIPFYARLSTLNGISPFTWSIQGAPLPDYLSLNSQTGEITGSAATEETTYTKVAVTDGAGNTAIADLTITVSPLCETVDEPDVPPGTTPVAYGRAPWIPSLQSRSALVTANYFSENLIKFLPSMYGED